MWRSVSGKGRETDPPPPWTSVQWAEGATAECSFASYSTTPRQRGWKCFVSLSSAASIVGIYGRCADCRSINPFEIIPYIEYGSQEADQISQACSCSHCNNAVLLHFCQGEKPPSGAWGLMRQTTGRLHRLNWQSWKAKQDHNGIIDWKRQAGMCPFPKLFLCHYIRMKCCNHIVVPTESIPLLFTFWKEGIIM